MGPLRIPPKKRGLLIVANNAPSSAVSCCAVVSKPSDPHAHFHADDNGRTPRLACVPKTDVFWATGDAVVSLIHLWYPSWRSCWPLIRSISARLAPAWCFLPLRRDRLRFLCSMCTCLREEWGSAQMAAEPLNRISSHPGRLPGLRTPLFAAPCLHSPKCSRDHRGFREKCLVLHHFGNGASMGPRLISRGNGQSALGGRIGGRASMGPRLISRGNISACP
jgi:hypothetical protein